jgi:hypothetical protein
LAKSASVLPSGIDSFSPRFSDSPHREALFP